MRGIVNIFFLILMIITLILSLYGIALIPIYFLLVFFGSAKRYAKVKRKVESILMPGEQLVADVIEYRVMSLFRRRAAIAITTSRIIYIQRKNLGGFRMEDRQWKDLRDARMDENILPGLFGASLSFSFVSPPGGKMEVNGVNPEGAAAMYTYSQTQEQAWEEKRRIRELEEKRAAAGGVNLHGLPSQQQAEVAQPRIISGHTLDVSTTDIVASEINRAKALLDAGAISDAEFQEIKSKILSKHFN